MWDQLRNPTFGNRVWAISFRWRNCDETSRVPASLFCCVQRHHRRRRRPRPSRLRRRARRSCLRLGRSSPRRGRRPTTAPSSRNSSPTSRSSSPAPPTSSARSTATRRPRYCGRGADTRSSTRPGRLRTDRHTQTCTSQYSAPLLCIVPEICSRTDRQTDR